MGKKEAKYPDIEERCRAKGSSAEALGRSDVIEERVINAIEGLRDKHLEVRMACVEALGRLGVKEERVINALVEGLRDKYVNVRTACAEALVRLGVKEERVINALIKGLTDENPWVMESFALALEMLGVKREQAINALEEIDQKELRKEIEFFNAEIDGKLKKCSGKYVAIKNCKVIAKGNSYAEVSKKVKRTPYEKARCILIRKVEKERPIHFISVPLPRE